MWKGSYDAGDDAAEDSRRLSIELAIAQHTGGSNASYNSTDEQNNENGGNSSLHPNSTDGDDDHPHDNNGGNRSPSERSDDNSHEKKEDESDDDDAHAAPMVPSEAPRGKPEAMAAKLANAARMQYKMEEVEVVAEPVEAVEGDTVLDTSVVADNDAMAEPVSTPSAQPKTKKKKSTGSKAKGGSNSKTIHPTMDDPTFPVTDDEYNCLETLMIQFCRVPLLAEFSRPVALLHPELMSVYTKIVEHPLDLGFVCRKIRKRDYDSLRDVRLDAWRIFSNCVKYHSHASNKDAVPSFVSIALHLRDHFNDLWQEFMLPSDPPPAKTKPPKTGPEAQLREAFAKRKEDRKKRLIVSGLSVMTGKSLTRAADSLEELLENGLRVDILDKEPIIGDQAEEDDDDIEVVVQNLNKLKSRFRDCVTNGDEIGIDELESDARKCYTHEVLENNPTLQMRIANRLDRWIGKIVVPIHEATCRGVSQSSIWGCMAAAVWARESSKKPFWPALVLGILAPGDQREPWHSALTERNEGRLPGKLKNQLVSGKRKSESALKKQDQGQLEPQSFFLVEFLGTHEFIWVREADIVENFDPADDPNQQNGTPGNKKKRSSRSNIANIIGSKTYASAVEEAKWALEEYELQLQDVGNEGGEEEDDGYSYPVLCQSDDEADDVETQTSKKSMDVDDLNELLATEGLIDFTANGRKNAKKRAHAVKKQKMDAEKKSKADKAKKVKAEQSKKKQDAKALERESKKEMKELEKRRKKRARERERALKGAEQTKKKMRVSDSEDLKKSASGRRNLIAGKRERAAAIVEGYLCRALQRNDYKSLSLGGVLTIPAALIDSTGILGMAMAFRAAAGELPMPDESGDQNSNIKPWDAVKMEEKKKSSERVECLEMQMILLEKEIERVKAATARRKALADGLQDGYAERDSKMQEEDKSARQNPLKKKPPPSAEKKAKGGKGKSSTDKDAGDDGNGSTTADVEVDASEVHTTASHTADDATNADSSDDEPMTESAADRETEGEAEVMNTDDEKPTATAVETN